MGPGVAQPGWAGQSKDNYKSRCYKWISITAPAGRGTARLGEARPGADWQRKAKITMKPWARKRLDITTWRKLRKRVWLRDDKKCVQCVTEGRPHPEVSLRKCHIDHIVPLSKRGSNKMSNLRTLCRYHHVLRVDFAHRGMIAKALQDEIIPPDWRKLVW